jgi:hypothetical protein
MMKFRLELYHPGAGWFDTGLTIGLQEAIPGQLNEWLVRMVLVRA